MARSKTFIKSARFVYSPYSATEMQGFGQFAGGLDPGAHPKRAEHRKRPMNPSFLLGGTGCIVVSASTYGGSVTSSSKRSAPPWREVAPLWTFRPRGAIRAKS